ncbi:uncharacterized protein LOC124941237 [Impatiens glandulifera]|uniref:uncharacterized protein LOC124941237 n=1 Tax=Impatiens glandulifera TaxID=253017 RepID=UPI001FB19F4E|nr:uncharacterized protein LOC124941237 [Impatiens glandulifera]
MADTRMNDDEWFGDFKFASSLNQSPTQLNQINGRHADADDDDDDEWGDFVEFPLRSEVSGGLSHAQSPSTISKPIDFGFSTDPTTQHPEFVASPTQSAQWVKPKGALPLSLFGDADEDEDKEKEENVSVLSQSGLGANDTSADKNLGNLKYSFSKWTGVSVNNVLDNLYNQNQQINVNISNGEHENPPKANGFVPSSSGLDPNPGPFHTNGGIANLNGSNVNMNEMHLNPSAESSNMNGLISNSSELNSHMEELTPKAGVHSTKPQSGHPTSGQSDAVVDLFARDGVSQISETTGHSRTKSDSSTTLGLSDSMVDLFARDGSSQISDVTGLSRTKSESSTTLGQFGSIGDLFARDGSSSQISDVFPDPNGLNSSWGEFHGHSSPNASVSNTPMFEFPYTTGGLDKIDGDDDDNEGWEFKDAFSEEKIGQLDGKVFHGVQENSEPTVSSSGYSYDFSNGHPASNEGNSGSIFEFTELQNDLSSDLHEETKQDLNFDPLVTSFDANESFGEFTSVAEGTMSKKESSEDKNQSSSSTGGMIFEERAQESILKPVKFTEALPLSIFGEEELEADNRLNAQDALPYSPSYKRHDKHSQDSKISIKDLLSNLYSQSEQNSPVSHVAYENGVNSSHFMPSPLNGDVVDDDDDFDNASWEFKDASNLMRVEEQTSHLDSGNTNKEISAEVKTSSLVEFYSKLKVELLHICGSHLENLKNSRSSVALSVEDAKAVALDEEIQKASEELHNLGLLPGYAYQEDTPSREIDLDQFIDVLREEEFQVLESEYQLSRRLKLADNDLKAAVEILKHVTSMLKILTLASTEEQHLYVSIWLKVISSCVQELRHASRIWKQSLDKNIHEQILSEPQGKLYILALGEVYRVAVTIGASAKLYKPWILFSCANSTTFYATLQECDDLWSSSKLQEALQNISDPIQFECHGTVKSLLECTQYIQEVDAIVLEDYLFNQHDPICQLSALPAGSIPDMKLVLWNNNTFFLKLANLWANLICCDPPIMPHLRVG